MAPSPIWPAQLSFIPFVVRILAPLSALSLLYENGEDQNAVSTFLPYTLLFFHQNERRMFSLFIM